MMFMQKALKDRKYAVQCKNYKENPITSNRNLLAEVAPREGRMKPCEEDSMDEVLATFCI